MHHRWTYRVLRPDLQMQTSPAAAFYVQLNLKQGLSLNSYQNIFCFMTYMGVCVQSLIYSQQTRFYKSAHPQTHMIYFALWLEVFFNRLQSCKTFEYLVSPVDAYKAEHLHRRYAQSTHRRIGAGFILLLKETRYISAEFCTGLWWKFLNHENKAPRCNSEVVLDFFHRVIWG